MKLMQNSRVNLSCFFKSAELCWWKNNNKVLEAVMVIFRIIKSSLSDHRKADPLNDYVYLSTHTSCIPPYNERNIRNKWENSHKSSTDQVIKKEFF